MLHSTVLAFLVLAWSVASTYTAAAQTTVPEPDSGGVVCQPGIYLASPDDCLPLGPSGLITNLARSGLTYPQTPLPAIKPDPALADLPYHYFHVISDDPVYMGSAPGATGGQALFPGFVYVGYVDRIDTGHGIYYLSQSGGWVPGRGERVGEIPSFQGLEFRHTPASSFGWTFEDIPVRSGPGYGTGETGRRLLPFSAVPIYSTEPADGADWNMIGPDEWIEARKVAQVVINTSSPDGAGESSRWIDVNLAEQTLAVYDQNRLVFATMIATGMEPFWTKPGTYQIYSKIESETMRNNDPSDFYYLDNVPWTMYFDGPRALHGAYWRTRFGYPQSHGCVNLSVGDAHWLFKWAHEGDWVYVHDPTGLTPTDPALYKGGAY
ncbi:MAG TPA: L,D-transpeptidase [Anaerolineales bacterium]